MSVYRINCDTTTGVSRSSYTEEPPRIPVPGETSTNWKMEKERERARQEIAVSLSGFSAKPCAYTINPGMMTTRRV